MPPIWQVSIGNDDRLLSSGPFPCLQPTFNHTVAYQQLGWWSKADLFELKKSFENLHYHAS